MKLTDPESKGRVDCSETTARDIDVEVKQLLDIAYQQARQILEEHQPQLDAVARALLEKETLDATEFQLLLEKSNRESREASASSSS